MDVGEYVITVNDNFDYDRIIYELTCMTEYLTLVMPTGDNINKYIPDDDFGLTPMHFFEKDKYNYWVIKFLDEDQLCIQCRSPWCLKHNDFHGESHVIID